MHIAVILCTYNGAAYLPQQLRSLDAQTHADYRIYASDDGSIDATPELLQAHRRQYGDVRIALLRGPGRGPAANFLATVNNPHVQADAYAYCDQDDVWHADKLARAAAALQRFPADLPALYCARTRLIDAAGRDLGASSLCRRPPGFANALVQCLAGGNTMVFNNAARRLLHVPHVDVLNYDWWTYLAVTGCGGAVTYDPEPVLAYRQHSGNFMGRNAGLPAYLKRARMMNEGVLRDWNERNAAALRQLYPQLGAEQRRRFELFTAARLAARPAERVWRLQRSGVYRQTVVGQAGLMLAAWRAWL